MRQALASTLILMALASACASPPPSVLGAAPQPAKSVDASRFYTGTWLEVARRPMLITDGCVAGTTSYRRAADSTVAVKDACRVGDPSGRERSIEGTGRILDTATNAKLGVRYTALISRDYWVVDRADDYSWMMTASPNFRDLYIYTRAVPSKRQLDRLVARAAALGYDTSQLEFPAQPPR